MKKTFLLLSFLTLSILVIAQTPEENLKSLGITLPKQSSPIANYVNYVRTGNLIYFSGSDPRTTTLHYLDNFEFDSDVDVNDVLL